MGALTSGAAPYYYHESVGSLERSSPPPQSPRAFIAGIVTALTPFMDGWTCREGVTDLQVHEVLRPFFGACTVGDAALMLAQLGAAALAMPGETAGEGDCSAFGALCEAKSMLEGLRRRGSCLGARLR